VSASFVKEAASPLASWGATKASLRSQSSPIPPVGWAIAGPPRRRKRFTAWHNYEPWCLLIGTGADHPPGELTWSKYDFPIKTRAVNHLCYLNILCLSISAKRGAQTPILHTTLPTFFILFFHLFFTILNDNVDNEHPEMIKYGICYNLLHCFRWRAWQRKTSSLLAWSVVPSCFVLVSKRNDTFIVASSLEWISLTRPRVKFHYSSRSGDWANLFLVNPKIPAPWSLSRDLALAKMAYLLIIVLIITVYALLKESIC